MAAYIHETPGRLRIKSARVRRNQLEAERAQIFMEDLRGVDTVSINTLTGSVVVNYNARRTSSRQILEALASEGHLDMKKSKRGEKTFEDILTDAGHKAARFLIGVALERVLGRTPLSFLTILV